MTDAVNVQIGNESLVDDYHCLISAITITPLVKKQYLTDVPGADGSRDLSSWFGSARFEMRTMKIYCQSCSDSAVACAEKMNNRWTGNVVEIRLSFEPDLYYQGTIIQVKPNGASKSDEICITVLCEPCRYRDYENQYYFPASESLNAYTLVNNGSIDVAPTLTAEGSTVMLHHGNASYSIGVGAAVVPGLVIPANSQINVSVSGGALWVRYREAIR